LDSEARILQRSQIPDDEKVSIVLHREERPLAHDLNRRRGAVDERNQVTLPRWAHVEPLIVSKQSAIDVPQIEPPLTVKGQRCLYAGNLAILPGGYRARALGQANNLTIGNPALVRADNVAFLILA